MPVSCCSHIPIQPAPRRSQCPSAGVSPGALPMPVPRQAFLPVWRRLDLPVRLLILTPLLGSVGAVDGDVEFQDNEVMHRAVNDRTSGHGVGEYELPLGKDQTGGDDQRRASTAFSELSAQDCREQFFLEGVQHCRWPDVQRYPQVRCYRVHQFGGAVAVAYQQFRQRALVRQ